MAEPTMVIALDMDRVSKVVNIPKSTLAYWETTGVFSPTHLDPNPRTPYRRIYSFRDVVSLRALGDLRRNLNIKLDDLRRAGQYLSEFYEAPWAQLRFGVVARRLVFRDPETNRWRSVEGQAVLPIDLENLPFEVQQMVELTMKRDVTQFGQVTRQRNVSHNRPVIAGTRIPVSIIKEFAADGYSAQEIIEHYPQLSLLDVEAALAHVDPSRAA